jgi:hypothetical protein
MQNQQQMAQMAAMNANNAAVDGTPIMGNMPHPKRVATDPAEKLNTYIYDYFLRNKHLSLARAMLECDLKMLTEKPSPNNRANGIDSMDSIEDLPHPQLPQNQVADNSFLLDWWVQFWDIYQATKPRNAASKNAAQYINHTRVSNMLMFVHGGVLTKYTEPRSHAERAAEPADDDEQHHERSVSADAQRRHGERCCTERAQACSSHEQPTVRLPDNIKCTAPLANV